MKASHHETGQHYERMARNIHPGGWAIESERPIATVLGSCVAVCLHDPRLKIGGMNHFMLPSGPNSPNAAMDVVMNGDYAMEVLVNALLNRGAKKNSLIAKAFGGGTIVSSIRSAIGERNAAFAREWLARESIPLVSSDLDGPWSRKVVFVPHSGDAFCRRIPATPNKKEELAEVELKYESQLEQQIRETASQRITLF